MKSPRKLNIVCVLTTAESRMTIRQVKYYTTETLASARSNEVVLLLLIHCLLLLPLLRVFVFGSCFCNTKSSFFSSCAIISLKEEGAGCFGLCCAYLPHGAIGRSAFCDFGSSWSFSYSLTLCLNDFIQSNVYLCAMKYAKF